MRQSSLYKQKYNPIDTDVMTETVTVTNNNFTTSFEPLEGKCIGNEVKVYMPDGTIQDWEQVSFASTQGTLVGAGMTYHLMQLKIN